MKSGNLPKLPGRSCNLSIYRGEVRSSGRRKGHAAATARLGCEGSHRHASDARARHVARFGCSTGARRVEFILGRTFSRISNEYVADTRRPSMRGDVAEPHPCEIPRVLAFFSNFVSQTSKIHNFHIRAHFSTFFICTRK